MAPKKKGPFFFFMRDLQNERRERNQPCSLDAVREEAGERWKTLTEEQRAQYEVMANDFKERGRGALHNKFTSDGRTIAGFIRAFHKFVDPGPIPLGFASAAKDHSEATHGIPITGFEEGTTDYRSVVRDLMAYLRLPIDEPNLPPLFCMQDHIPQAIGCLRWLEERGRLNMDFPVWDILPLLRKLRNVAGEDISHAEAENILNSALFDYEQNCPYHLDIDNKNCALGECRRLGYKMSNALLPAYKIDRIIDYQHLPPRLDPSLNFEVSQMNVRPARMVTSRRPQGASGDHGSYYHRSSHAPAPLPREPRRVEDYYAEQRVKAVS
ncbi:hypothetical protein HPB49_015620 [Dermacentor silvarum]|uniref:Uncharacterized protein n=1 Tax=Dermacentor silvarum TaxID=543639 RepID=A0ACB8CLS1_DERSI|nr:hypothetical protein HPB49_015620 [Dermacentor silvarum]